MTPPLSFSSFRREGRINANIKNNNNRNSNKNFNNPDPDDGVVVVGATSTTASTPSIPTSTTRREFQKWMQQLTWSELQEKSAFLVDANVLHEMIAGQVAVATPIHPRACSYCQYASACGVTDGRFDAGIHDWQRRYSSQVFVSSSWKRQRRRRKQQQHRLNFQARLLRLVKINNNNHKSSWTVLKRGFLQGDGTRYAIPLCREQQEADMKLLHWVQICTPFDETTTSRDNNKFLWVVLKDQIQQQQQQQTKRNGYRENDNKNNMAFWEFFHLLRIASRGNFLGGGDGKCCWFQPTERWFPLAMYLAAHFEMALRTSHQQQKQKQQQQPLDHVDGIIGRRRPWWWYQSSSCLLTIQQLSKLSPQQAGLSQLIRQVLQEIMQSDMANMRISGSSDGKPCIRDLKIRALLLESHFLANSTTTTTSATTLTQDTLDERTAPWWLHFWTCPLLECGSVTREEFAASIRTLLKTLVARQIEQELLQDDNNEQDSKTPQQQYSKKGKKKKKKNRKMNTSSGGDGVTSHSTILSSSAASSTLSSSVMHQRQQQQQQPQHSLAPPRMNKTASGNNSRRGGRMAVSTATTSSASTSRLCKWEEGENEEDDADDLSEHKQDDDGRAVLEIVETKGSGESKKTQHQQDGNNSTTHSSDQSTPHNPDITTTRRDRNQNIIHVLGILDDVVQYVFETVDSDRGGGVDDNKDSGHYEEDLNARNSNNNNNDNDQGGGWQTARPDITFSQKRKKRLRAATNKNRKEEVIIMLKKPCKATTKRKLPNVNIGVNNSNSNSGNKSVVSSTRAAPSPHPGLLPYSLASFPPLPKQQQQQQQPSAVPPPTTIPEYDNTVQQLPAPFQGLAAATVGFRRRSNDDKIKQQPQEQQPQEEETPSAGGWPALSPRSPLVEAAVASAPPSPFWFPAEPTPNAAAAPSSTAVRASGTFDIFASRPYGNLAGGFFLRPESIDFAWDTHDFAFDQWPSQREQSIMHDLFLSQERREQEMASSTIASIASSGPDTEATASADDLLLLSGVDDFGPDFPTYDEALEEQEAAPPDEDDSLTTGHDHLDDDDNNNNNNNDAAGSGGGAFGVEEQEAAGSVAGPSATTASETDHQQPAAGTCEISLPYVAASVAPLSSVSTSSPSGGKPLELPSRSPGSSPKTLTKVEIVIPSRSGFDDVPSDSYEDLSVENENESDKKPLVEVVAVAQPKESPLVVLHKGATSEEKELSVGKISHSTPPSRSTNTAPSPPILVSLADLQTLRRADSGDQQASDVRSSSSVPATAATSSGAAPRSPKPLQLKPRMVTSLSGENLRSFPETLAEGQKQHQNSASSLHLDQEPKLGGSAASATAGLSKHAKNAWFKARDDNDINKNISLLAARRRSDASYRAVASRSLRSRDDYDVQVRPHNTTARSTPPRVASLRAGVGGGGGGGGSGRSNKLHQQYPIFGPGGNPGAPVLPEAPVCARSEIGQDDDYRQMWQESRRATSNSNLGAEDGDHILQQQDGSTTITSALSHEEEERPAATAEENLREERDTYRDLCLTLGAEVAKLRNMLAAQNNYLMVAPHPLDQVSHHPSYHHYPQAPYQMAQPTMSAPSKYFDHPASLSHLVNTAARSQTLAAMSDAGQHESMASEDGENFASTPKTVTGGGTAAGKVHLRQVSSGATAASDAASLEGQLGSHAHHLTNVTVGVPLSAPNTSQSNHHFSGGVQSRLSVDIMHFVDMTTSQLRKQEGRRLKAVERMTRLVTALWPRAQIKLYGSHITGLSLPTSDVDFVICLPAVQKDAPAQAPGVLEGRNAINETSQKLLARKLKSESWIDPRSLKLIERTVVPVIKVATKDTKAKTLQLDITFDAPSHHGLEAVVLVNHLLEEFPMIRPLVLVLKQFLLDRGLLTGYTGGLSSYCLFLMTARYLQEQAASWADCGALLMGFLDFYGNHFDPRTTGISVRLCQYFPRSNYVMAGPSPQPPMVPWNTAANPPAIEENNMGSSAVQFRAKNYVRRNSFSDNGNVDGVRGATTGAGRSRANANHPRASTVLPTNEAMGGGTRPQVQTVLPHVEAGPDHGMPYTFDPLFVEDPLALGNNVGRNTFRIFQVLRAFSDAHRALVASLEWDMQSSVGEDVVTEYPLLKCLLQSEDVVFDL